MNTYHILIQVLSLIGICLAKGGFGGGGRGVSAARSSVSSGGFRASSSGSSGSFRASNAGSSAGSFASSPGRTGFSSAAKGAAVGGATGFVAGMATHSMLSSHVPIVIGHRSYYWSNSYSPSHKRNMEKCSVNLTEDPIFSELQFDNSTDNSTYPEAVVWECPVGRCDLQNMECIENDKSIIIIVVVVIVSVLGLTVFFVLCGRWKKQCTQRCEAQRRREYEIGSSRGGGPTDGMAPLPRTPIPRSPVRRPYSAKI